MNKCLVSTVVFGVMAGLVYGETTNDMSLLPDVVVIGSKEAVSELPASGDYLDVDEIRSHSYDNIHQVLRKTTGVYVQEENGYGLLPNISLRGVDTHRSAKITLMEDGVLTAPAPYSAPSAYYAPTMGRMSGLEVLKGTSQVKYGPHTTGGAINYLSTPIPAEPGGYLKLLYGSYNDLRIHGTYGGMVPLESGGQFGALVEIYRRQTDGFKTIEHSSGSDNGTGFDKTDYMVKLAWLLEDDMNQRFELKVGYTEFGADETYLGLSETDFANDAYQRYYASQFDNFEGEHWRTYLRHYIELNDSARLTTTAYYSDYHRNWYKLQDIENVQGLAAGTVSMAQAIASGGPALACLRGENAGTWRIRANNRDYDLSGIQSTLASEFDTANTEHALLAGLRYHMDSVTRFQWQDEATVDNGGNVTAVSYGARGGAGNRVQEAAAAAGFVQDEMTWGKLSITPGIRAEYIDMAVNNRASSTGTQTGSDEVFAAGISTRYSLNDQALLFGGIYRGYSVPSPNDSINKDVEEETSMGGELGARLAGNGTAAQLSGFYTAFQDLIVGGFVGTANDTDTENAGNIVSYGAELKVEMDPAVIQGWSFRHPIWLAVTYTQARLDGDTTSSDPESLFAGGEDGNEVPYIPELQASLGIGLGFKKFDGEIIASYVDETYSTANNSDEQVNPVTGSSDARFGTLDSRLIVNTSVRYDLLDSLAVFVNVHNLFDEEYLASRHPHGPRPGQPMTAMAGVETTF